jgi:ribonuclease P protein component
VHRRFRLSSSTDIQRVRRLGKSYAHPLLVLVAYRNELGRTRIAVSAGRAVGKANLRNRAKRLLREAVRPLLPQIKSGWDLVLLARRPLPEARFENVQAALLQVLNNSHLLMDDVDKLDGKQTETG